MYKISIVLPVYNVEDYLEDSFNSILNQTFGFNNLELIYVDDYSTDGSKQIIQSFANKYENVKAIFLEENSGYAGKPRNIGIENATSEYIMFLDPDDIFLENACEFLYGEITKYNLNFISANFLNHINGEYKLNDWEVYFPNIKPKDRVYLNNVRDNMDIFKVAASVWTKIFKRQFLIDKDIRFPEGIAGEDLVFVVKCLTKTDEVLYINEPVVKYKIRESSSVTSKLSKSSLASYITAYNLFYELMYNFDSDYLWLAGRSLSSFWFFKLIASDLSDIDKVDLLKYSEDLIKVIVESNHFDVFPNQELFFNLCYEKKFYEAVELSKMIKFNKNNYSKDELLTKIKENIFFLIKNVDLKIIVELNRLFMENNYNITFLNIGENINLPENISKINLNEYYEDYMINGNGEVILNKDTPNMSLKFQSIDEFYKYSIEEILSDYNGSLLIYDSEIDMNDSNVNRIAICKQFSRRVTANAVIIDGCNDNSFTDDYSNVYFCRDIFSKDNFCLLEDIFFEVLAKYKFQKDNNIFRKLINYNLVIKENKKIKRENKELKNEINNLEIFKNSILNSSSWKMTKPLRKLKNLR